MSQVQPKLIIHGGTGGAISSQGEVIVLREILHNIVKQVYHLLLDGSTAKEAVLKGCQLLEDEPRFNAGTGSVLQSDGQIRMSAGLMDGESQRFSGVINVTRVKNPILLAEVLQAKCDRVLSDYGAVELSRELAIPAFDPVTDFRFNEWIEERKEHFSSKMARVVAKKEVAVNSEDRRGTIGVVALDSHGRIAAGTSTGGKGLERVGRVSDAPMPAGTYATTKAGVSCTGIGEDIIDVSLASRIVVRVTDGFSLEEAMRRSIKECHEQNRDLAAIALDATGAIAWGKTSQLLLAAYHNGHQIGDTLELSIEDLFGIV